jgi:formylmethanofuran dehydrogenase subunit E
MHSVNLDPDPPDAPPVVTIMCAMCKRQVPKEHTRTFSGRLLCLGCLSAWYGEDDDGGEDGQKD